MTTTTLELFAGPGGWSQGAHILGHPLNAHAIEISKDAVATATAAGHPRILGDVNHANPADYEHVTGLIASSPCPSFSAAGKRTGLGNDYQHVLDVWTSIGWGISADDALADLHVEDPRTALLAITGVWALTLPNLEWIALEQVPSVEYAWMDLAAELYGADWATVDVRTLDAMDFGVPSRRKRTFLIAHRTRPLGYLPITSGPTRSMAEALDWGPGERVNTRGARRTSGGNWFSADNPSWCLTGKARGWYRESDGLRLTPGQAGLLNGFPPDYPWSGSRSSAFQQAADVVSPVMAAYVLGAAWGVDCETLIQSYASELYGDESVLAA